MTNPNDGAPLTRRQLRELAAAQAAGQSPAPAGEIPTPQAPPAAPVAFTAPPVAPPAQVAPARPATQPMRTRAVPTPVAPTEGFAPAAPAAGPQAPLASRRSAIPGLVPDDAGTASPANRPGPAAQAPVPSRRSLREQTASHRVVIVPPTQSSAIRTIDETGQLSRVLDLGSGRPAMTARPQPAGPTPDVTPRSQRLPAQQQGAPQQPAPQRLSAQGLAAQPGGAQQSSWSARPGTPTGAPGIAGQLGQPGQPAAAQQAGRAPVGDRPQTFAPQGPSAFAPGAPAARPVDPAQAPLLREQAAREQAARDQAAREQASRTAAPGAVPASWQPTASPAEKPWAAQDPIRPAALPVEGAPAQFRQRITAPGFEPVPALQLPPSHVPAAELAEALPQWDAITTPPPAPARPADAGHDDDDDFDDDDEPDHKYTWLHYLILVAVAFVLGLIIWKVGLEDRGVASPADSAASVGVVFDAPSAPYDHYL